MTWNYRAIRHNMPPRKIGDLEFDASYIAIHEVYYDDDGKPEMRSKEPVTFQCDVEDGKEGIIAALERALATIRETDVMDDPWPDA